MDVARVENDPHGRATDGGQARDLAGMVHPHLEDRRLMLRSQAKERERQPDLVVEVALGLEDRAERRERRGQQLLGAGLADRAGDPDHRSRRECRPVAGRERSEGRERVADDQSGKIGDGIGNDGSPRDDRGHCPRACGGGQEGMSVEVLTPKRDEEIARSETAGIGADARRSPRAASRPRRPLVQETASCELKSALMPPSAPAPREARRDRRTATSGNRSSGSPRAPCRPREARPRGAPG